MSGTLDGTNRTGLATTILVFLLGIIVFPALIGIVYHTGLHLIFGFVGSILVFQPVAAAIGIGLGIPPVPVILIMFSAGLSVIFILFGICDLFAGKSAWLREHLDKVNDLAQSSSLFRRYGILMVIPFIWVPGIGLYGCVLLAWLFRWRGMRGIGMILTGWMLSSLLVLLASVSAMSLIR